VGPREGGGGKKNGKPARIKTNQRKTGARMKKKRPRLPQPPKWKKRRKSRDGISGKNAGKKRGRPFTRFEKPPSLHQGGRRGKGVTIGPFVHRHRNRPVFAKRTSFPSNSKGKKKNQLKQIFLQKGKRKKKFLIEAGRGKNRGRRVIST